MVLPFFRTHAGVAAASAPGAGSAWPVGLTCLAWGLLALGALLRLARFAAGLSLWLDEGALALNIVQRSFGALLKPLDYDQAAPVGFLLMQKACSLLPGAPEYTLRLPALVAALASLPLFFGVARRCLPPRGAVAALALFAVLDPLVHYATEVKPYELDAALALAGTWAGLAVLQEHSGPRAARAAWALALVGVPGVWFSHPLIFVLAGVGLALAWRWWRGGRSGALHAGLAAATAGGASATRVMAPAAEHPARASAPGPPRPGCRRDARPEPPGTSSPPARGCRGAVPSPPASSAPAPTRADRPKPR